MVKNKVLLFQFPGYFGNWTLGFEKLDFILLTDEKISTFLVSSLKDSQQYSSFSDYYLLGSIYQSFGFFNLYYLFQGFPILSEILIFKHLSAIVQNNSDINR